MKETELRIRTWPDPLLKKKCKKINQVNSQVRRLLDRMYDLMKKNGGVGLAASQVGLDSALIVIETADKLFKLISPRILKKEGSIVFEEGCLSFPGLMLRIKRANKVWVSALDEGGNPLDIEVEGLLAVIFQHEIDHINGVVFIDRIPLWRKILIQFRLRRMEKR